MEEEYQPSNSVPRKGVSPIVFLVVAVLLIGVSFLGAFAYLKHQNTVSQANAAYHASGSGTGGNSGSSYYLSNGNGSTSTPPPASDSSSCNGEPTLMMNIGGQQVQTCGRPVEGQATVVNSSSLTVQPSSGSAQTFNITSSTKIVKQDHSMGTASDIAVGDTVVVIPSNAPNQAGYILVNPNLQTQ